MFVTQTRKKTSITGRRQLVRIQKWLRVRTNQINEREKRRRVRLRSFIPIFFFLVVHIDNPGFLFSFSIHTRRQMITMDWFETMCPQQSTIVSIQPQLSCVCVLVCNPNTKPTTYIGNVNCNLCQEKVFHHFNSIYNFVTFRFINVLIVLLNYVDEH